MNMVKALERKSEPTIERAVAMDPENLREVMKVTLPAITRHINAFTADLVVVSEKEAGASLNLPPFKYSCFLDCNTFRVSSTLFSFCIAFSLSLVILASSFSSCLMMRLATSFSPLAAVLARTIIPFLRIDGDGLKPFIVVVDDRIVGETLANDETDVAAKAAINTTRRFERVLDEFILRIVWLCICVGLLTLLSWVEGSVVTGDRTKK